MSDSARHRRERERLTRSRDTGGSGRGIGEAQTEYGGNAVWRLFRFEWGRTREGATWVLGRRLSHVILQKKRCHQGDKEYEGCRG